jgi:hypothetical protein
MPRQKSLRSFPFEHVDRVTDQHAEKFARYFFTKIRLNDVMAEAVAECGVITFPEGDGDWNAPASPQRIFGSVQFEIAKAVRKAIRPAMKKAFRDAAARALNLTSEK